MVWLFVFDWLRPVTDWLLGLKWQGVELSQGMLSGYAKEKRWACPRAISISKEKN